MSGLLRDYAKQAETYDATRGASPSVVAPLREALAGAPGRRLVDVGDAPRSPGTASVLAWAKPDAA